MNDRASYVYILASKPYDHKGKAFKEVEARLEDRADPENQSDWRDLYLEFTA